MNILIRSRLYPSSLCILFGRPYLPRSLCSSSSLSSSSPPPSSPLSSPSGETPICLKVGDSAHKTKIFTHDDVLAFSRVSTDTNPLHLDPSFASQAQYGVPVVHGLLTASLLSAVVGTSLPGAGTIYLSQTLKFKSPVLVGDSVTATVTVKAIRKEHRIVVMRTHCTARTPGDKNHQNHQDRVVIEGEAMVLVPGPLQ
eukprot:TRINITY_DN13061_c0_g1_i1.p1 TRINITY_DN13061_c0_g1~~TRINITY_DN13061_c0_g1_i1.p1  ORF type:complete len:198 (+),score=35.50 TRINITY_DN13061_c0_g1_i1:280-873(+)